MTPEWAAGFIAADGTIQIDRQGRVYVEVEQVEPAPLFQLSTLYGGRVHKRRTRGVWRWRVAARHDVIELLTELSAHTAESCSKRQQAEVALGYLGGVHSLELARRDITALKGQGHNVK